MTVIRSRWRVWAWATACVAVVLAAATLGALVALATLPLLDRAFANFHRAQNR